MDIELLQKHFGEMGARVKVREIVRPRWGWRPRNTPGVDIHEDQKGEFFDIRLNIETPLDYRVIDLSAVRRHLLLMAEPNKWKFLCGFDERHWFVCGVPGNGITNVRR